LRVLPDRGADNPGHRGARDGMALSWPVKNPPREKLEGYAAKIKASLG